MSEQPIERGVPIGLWTLMAGASAVALAQIFESVMLWPHEAGQTAAWLALLISAAYTMVVYGFVAATKAKVGARNLIDMAQMGAGRPGAILAGLMVAGLLTYHAGFVLRQTAEMAVTSLFPLTPQTLPMTGMLICILAGASMRPDQLLRLSRLFLPVLLVSLTGILVGAVGWGRIGYLTPFWGPGPGPLFLGSIALTGFYTPVVLYLHLAGGELKDLKQVTKASLLAIALSAGVFAITEVVVLMALPTPIGDTVPFPVHALSRLVLGGRFFERIESVWLGIWVFGGALHLSALVQASALAYNLAFGARSHRSAILPILVLVGTVGLFPPDQESAIRWHVGLMPFASAIALGFPLLLALLLRIRGGGKARGQQSPSP